MAKVNVIANAISININEKDRGMKTLGDAKVYVGDIDLEFSKEEKINDGYNEPIV